MTTETIWLKTKPSVSDVEVQIGKDGKLNVGGLGQNDQQSAWNNIFNRYKNFIVGISGIGALTMVVLFIMQLMKLATHPDNPQARTQALNGVLWTGIATALLGGVTIVAAFFYNAI